MIKIIWSISLIVSIYANLKIVNLINFHFLDNDLHADVIKLKSTTEIKRKHLKQTELDVRQSTQKMKDLEINIRFIFTDSFLLKYCMLLLGNIYLICKYINVFRQFNIYFIMLIHCEQ